MIDQMIPSHKDTGKLGTSGKGNVVPTEDTKQDIVRSGLETGGRAAAPPAAPSGTWSSEKWGVVAAVVIALIVIGAALAIILKVGRGPVAGDSSNDPPTIAVIDFNHLNDPGLDQTLRLKRVKPELLTKFVAKGRKCLKIQGLTNLSPAGVLAVRRGGIKKENTVGSGISGLVVEGL